MPYVSERPLQNWLVLIIAEEFARPASGGDAAGVSVRLRRLLASLSE